MRASRLLLLTGVISAFVVAPGKAAAQQAEPAKPVCTSPSEGVGPVTFSANPNPATVGQDVTFEGCGTAECELGLGRCPAEYFYWDFGDGTTTTDGNKFQVHAFTAPGVYLVKVDGQSVHGGSGHAEYIVTVTEPLGATVDSLASIGDDVDPLPGVMDTLEPYDRPVTEAIVALEGVAFDALAPTDAPLAGVYSLVPRNLIEQQEALLFMISAANAALIDKTDGAIDWLLYAGPGPSRHQMTIGYRRASDHPDGGSRGGIPTPSAAELKNCKKSRNVTLCLKARDTQVLAERMLIGRFTGRHLAQHSIGDAFLHCTWIGHLSMTVPDNRAREYGEWHEDRPRAPKDSATRHREAKAMDLFNNGQGISLGNLSGNEFNLKNSTRLTNECETAARNGTLWRLLPNKNFPSRRRGDDS